MKTTAPKKPAAKQGGPRTEKPARQPVAKTNEAATAEASPASDQAGEPVCPRHQVAAIAGRTDGFFTHYHCPHEGCRFTTKRPLPKLKAKLDRENEQRRFEAR